MTMQDNDVVNANKKRIGHNGQYIVESNHLSNPLPRPRMDKVMDTIIPLSNLSNQKQPPRQPDFWVPLGQNRGCAVLPEPGGYTLTYKDKINGYHWVRRTSSFVPLAVAKGILSHAQKADMEKECAQSPETNLYPKRSERANTKAQ